MLHLAACLSSLSFDTTATSITKAAVPLPLNRKDQLIADALRLSGETRSIATLISSFTPFQPCPETAKKCRSYVAAQAASALFRAVPDKRLSQSERSAIPNHQALLLVMREIGRIIDQTRVFSLPVDCVTAENSQRLSEIILNTPFFTSLECFGEDRKQMLPKLFELLSTLSPTTLFGRLEELSCPSSACGTPAFVQLLQKMQRLTTLSLTWHNAVKLPLSQFDGFTKNYPQVTHINLTNCPHPPLELRGMLARNLNLRIQQVSCFITKGAGQTLNYAVTIKEGNRYRAIKSDKHRLLFERDPEILFNWDVKDATLRPVVRGLPRTGTFLPACRMTTTFEIEELLAFAIEYLQQKALPPAEQAALLKQVITWAQRNPQQVPENEEDLEAIIEIAGRLPQQDFALLATQLIAVVANASNAAMLLHNQTATAITTFFADIHKSSLTLKNTPVGPLAIKKLVQQAMTLHKVQHVTITITEGEFYTQTYRIEVQRQAKPRLIYLDGSRLRITKKPTLSFNWDPTSFTMQPAPAENLRAKKPQDYDVQQNMTDATFIKCVQQQLTLSEISRPEQFVLLESLRKWTVGRDSRVLLYQKQLTEVVVAARAIQLRYFHKSADALQTEIAKVVQPKLPKVHG